MPDAAIMLPLVFAALMALSFLIYAILDGYDLGVGLLLLWMDDEDKELALASIGPFWDANETWLVLGVGLLLIAFPAAHSLILEQLYLPAAILLIGLILRGVAYDFRSKVPAINKKVWDRWFFVGSVIATSTQGYMLGHYVLGFNNSPWLIPFAILSAACITSAYAFIGATWLVMKTRDRLQRRSIRWAQRTLWLMMLGIAVVSVVNPMVSERVFTKWFAMPEAILLLPIPALCIVVALVAQRILKHLLSTPGRIDWAPFSCAVLLFFLCFQALAYSFYPYIVPDKLTLWDAAAATPSLQFMGVGIAVVFPAILLYTGLSYRVFWGKAQPLRYY